MRVISPKSSHPASASSSEAASMSSTRKPNNDAPLVETVGRDGSWCVELQDGAVGHPERRPVVRVDGRPQTEHFDQQLLGGAEVVGFESEGVPCYAFDLHRVLSFLPLVERVGGRFPPVHMVPAVKSWRELLRTPFGRSSQNEPSGQLCE